MSQWFITPLPALTKRSVLTCFLGVLLFSLVPLLISTPIAHLHLWRLLVRFGVSPILCCAVFINYMLLLRPFTPAPSRCIFALSDACGASSDLSFVSSTFVRLTLLLIREHVQWGLPCFLPVSDFFNFLFPYIAPYTTLLKWVTIKLIP